MRMSAFLIAKLIRSRAFSTMTALEAGRLGRSDAEQLAFASEHQLAIVTHNRIDFEELACHYLSENRNHAGIIIAVRRKPNEIARRLLLLLNRITADEMDDKLIYI